MWLNRARCLELCHGSRIIITCFAGIQVDVVGDFELVKVVQEMVNRVFWHVFDEPAAAVEVAGICFWYASGLVAFLTCRRRWVICTITASARRSSSSSGSGSTLNTITSSVGL